MSSDSDEENDSEVSDLERREDTAESLALKTDDEFNEEEAENGDKKQQHGRHLSSSHVHRRKSTLEEQSALIAHVLGAVSGDEKSDGKGPSAVDALMNQSGMSIGMEEMGGSLIMSAQEEISERNRLKELINEKWDIIDPQDNGDVDEKEWVEGLRRLNVNMTDEECARMFNLIDGDNSGFVDRQEWKDFLTTNFHSEQLIAMQEAIMTRVNASTHNRLPSNLYNPANIDEDGDPAGDGSDDWDDDDLADIGRQMKEELRKQATKLRESIHAEQTFYEELEQMGEDDPDFAKPENAQNWTPKEVAWWLDSIDLVQYGKIFVDMDVDGTILLNDVSTHMLQGPLGVSSLHIGKILRGVDELRALNKDALITPYKDWNQLNEENEQLMAQLEETNLVLQDLQTDHRELQNEMMALMANQTNGDEQTKGMADEEDENKKQTTDDDADLMIGLLKSEVERLTVQKTMLAKVTGEEIQKLRVAVKVLQRELAYQTQTPFYSNLNPVQKFAEAMGYKKVN